MSAYLQLFSTFQQAIDERVRNESALADLQSGRADNKELELKQAYATAETLREAELTTCNNDYSNTRGELTSAFDAEWTELESQHRQTLQRIERTANDQLRDHSQKRQDSEWIVTSVLDDSAEDSPLREFERFKTLLLNSKEEQTATWEALERDCQAAGERWGLEPDTPLEAEQVARNREEASLLYSKSIEQARQHLSRLNSFWLPQLFLGWRPLLLILLLTVSFGVPVGMFTSPGQIGLEEVSRESPQWIGTSAGAGAIASLIVTGLIFAIAASQRGHAFADLNQSKAEAGWHHQQWISFAKEELARVQEDCDKKHRRVTRERQETLDRFEQTHAALIAEINIRREQELLDENSQYALAVEQLQRSREDSLQILDLEYAQRSQQLQIHWNREVQARGEALQRYLAERQRRLAETWMMTRRHWEGACQQLSSEVQSLHSASRHRAPAWEHLANGNWQPAPTIPAAIRLGDFDLHLERWKQAVPADMRLAPRNTQLPLPAELPFPQATSLLITYSTPSGRQPAVQLLQSTMLRLLASLPPGKVRFTLIDPVGLGESFAGFMHLADFDELLVTSRIWTEPGQIESRLADLTEHMENVLQKYLRNEFPTIEEYNQSAGEVAEPYHFLVLTDFPSKFSEIAARRLQSIVHSGPRCGVYTLMSYDTTRPLPNNFDAAALTTQMQVLEWQEQVQNRNHDRFDQRERFSLSPPRGSASNPDDALDVPFEKPPLPQYPVSAFYSRQFGPQLLPLIFDEPPPSDQFVELVRTIGEASKDARRVEVAFDRITPRPEMIWQGDSRSEIEIPLGRAGATKLQTLKLGRGTSQHMLIAGKTGSGKSTFLHILITNLALHYSPDEINFYLIDFKKGVEFKDYASFRLPHARVIAIESDREFGVSALQKLDAVLQERGELFRRHGVQDMAGFRKQNPEIPLPRILLIVDEFQEFFIEDDRLSQTATLLLDRLVRQGRAFGMHVVLGSQTLGGAYSLARSTLGQVAVRVALQCSEADAHLILSEENTAARLLTRPGEAIYNDANGRVEGNHPFQIAWLSDELREQLLKRIEQLALKQQLEIEPPVVFEGNIPSDLGRNAALRKLAASFSQRSEPISAPTIWLGDAVEIKPGTTLTFHRQTGNNLLLVGQDSEAAQGVMAAALLALGIQSTPTVAASNVILMDGSPADSVEADSWSSITQSLPRYPGIVSPRQAAETIQRLTAELARRMEDGVTKHPPMFLLVFNLSKFRDLRKPEDDFGMSSFSGTPKPAEPGKLFANLLAQGPENGIHTIAWCDSYNNVDRWFSRQTLRDLEQRIAFQMNASDSSNLIDSPQASRLGTHRALLYREETGTHEKFRPYGVPTPDFLSDLHMQLKQTEHPAAAASLEEFHVT